MAEGRLIVRQLGLQAYQPVWQKMKDFAADKSLKADEFWLVQHQPVYTKGIRCKEEPSVAASHIPVVAADRGGLMTYHGPGQLIVYTLVNLKRKNLSTKSLVNSLEQAVINLLARYDVDANRIDGAPGVYIGADKIASIGLRVRHQISYHGLSINFDMDLQPFDWINPCGFERLKVVQLKDLAAQFNWQQAQQSLLAELIDLLAYDNVEYLS